MALAPPPPVPTTAAYTKQYCEENVYLLAQCFSENPSVSELWDIFVVFISNETRSVALRNQKAAREPNGIVVWDYHVVLLLRQKGAQYRQPDPQDFFAEDQTDSDSDDAATLKVHRAWVYDFDTTNEEVPCTLRGLPDDQTEKKRLKSKASVCGVGEEEPLLTRHPSLFRIIKAEEFLMNFASDRSHMIKAVLDESDGLPGQGALPPVYCAPPPIYPPICGAAAAKKGIQTNLMTSFVSMLGTEETFGEVLNLQTLYCWY